MTKMTIYCVQNFWKDGRKLAAGSFRQFKTEAQAIDAGMRSRARNAGVLVFALEGEPEFEVWGEPRILARHGDVPRGTRE